MRNEAGEASPGRSNSYEVLQYISQRRRHGFNQFFTEVIGHQETELSESPAIQVVEITSAKELLFHNTLHISQFAFPSVLQHLFQTEWHSVKWRTALSHPCSQCHAAPVISASRFGVRCQPSSSATTENAGRAQPYWEPT